MISTAGTKVALVIISTLLGNTAPTINTSLRFNTMEACVAAKDTLEAGSAKAIGADGKSTSFFVQFYCIPSVS